MDIQNKCSECGKAIKRIYTFDGKVYGIECWKKVCLPIILQRNAERFDNYKRLQLEKDFAFIEMLKQKDLSRVKNQFKLTFIASLIKQFEEKGFVTQKQKDMVEKTYWTGRFYHNSWTNEKDHFNFMVAWWKVGDEETKKHVEWVFENNYEESVNSKFKEAIKDYER